MADVLDDDAIRQGLASLDGWEHADGMIRRSFEFETYRDATAFVMRVAMEAERMFHHPDVFLTWGRVDVSIVSHDAGGVTQQDLDLAGKLNTV